MEDKLASKNKLDFSKVLMFLSIVALGVVIGGLFFNSQPAKVNNRIVETSTRPQEIYFTAVKLPEKLDFSNETVPIDNFDVQESLDREMLSVANFHSQALLYIKKSNRYFSVIEPILKKHEIPDDFKYLALAESGFLDRVISPSGAVGIWQFMKSAAIENGLEVNEEVDERYHIEKATEAACKYLKKAFNIYGSWTFVAASYNAGVSGMNKQIEVQKSKNYYDLMLNDETSRYLFRILALKLIIGEPDKYGFKVSDEEKYPIIPVKDVKVTTSIKSFADFARTHHVNYKLLKLFNPWLRQPYLKNVKGKTYTLRIPETGSLRKFDFAESADIQ